MSKNKMSPDEKLSAVKRFLNGEDSQCSIATHMGISKQSFGQWIRNYKSMGIDAFTMTGNKRYSSELKLSAVQDYLAGLGSQDDICLKYGIRSKGKLQDWIMKYNSHEELKASGTGGTTIMTKGRKTTYDERVEIVQYCIKHENNYAVTAEKYQVSYQQVYTWIKKYEEKGGILGYRQMTIKLNRENDFHVNQKRIHRLMQILNLKSVCRRKRKNYVKSKPRVTAENILNRDFSADNFGEKWLTDVTEMKYGASSKAYLSAILDLGDKSIVSFVIGHSNNNDLVFKTFDLAHEQYPDVKPIFHSDRGFQYTTKTFKGKLDDAEMTQSMSRVSRCIDNGPMEAFWGGI